MTATAPVPSPGELLEWATARLQAAGIANARADAEWILADLLGVARSAFVLAGIGPVDSAVVARYEAAVGRRAGREPLQRVLGWEEFRGLRLQLSLAVLVPRPETELLVELALSRLPAAAERRLVVLDVGTGSGCIACAIAGARPDVDVIATDICVAALAVAGDNARRLGLRDRVWPVACDILTAVGDAGADLIVSNPPYLTTDVLATLMPEVRYHEPVGALDGGPDGLGVLERLIAQAAGVLRPGGSLVVETAGGAQAGAVATLMRHARFVEIGVHRDLPGIERFVSARTVSAPGRLGAA